MKYLGAVIKSDSSLIIDVNITIRKFYAPSNAILSHVKHASEMSKLYFYHRPDFIYVAALRLDKITITYK